MLKPGMIAFEIEPGVCSDRMTGRLTIESCSDMPTQHVRDTSAIDHAAVSRGAITSRVWDELYGDLKAPLNRIRYAVRKVGHLAADLLNVELCSAYQEASVEIGALDTLLRVPPVPADTPPRVLVPKPTRDVLLLLAASKARTVLSEYLDGPGGFDIELARAALDGLDRVLDPFTERPRQTPPAPADDPGPTGPGG